MLGLGLGIPDIAVFGGAKSQPVFLPNVPLSDVAILGSSSAYIDIGTMSLPAGDWCIGMACKMPTTIGVDYFLLSLGTQSDTILTNSGTLTIGLPGATGSPKFSYGYAAVGYDDTGTGLSPWTGTWFASSNQQGVSGPQQAAGALDGATRAIFVQSQGGVVSVWQVDNNCRAIQCNQQTPAFGAIAAKAARLGCLGKVALSGFSTISYQRPFRIAQALTQYQMEAFTAGVDPRFIPGVNFSAANGDLLFAFNSQASDGKTYTDLIQGQAATAHGTFSAAPALLPTTIDQNQLRADLDRYRIFQSSGATTDIPFQGAVYGADGVIQVRLVNKGDLTVQVPYTTICTSANGQFSGVLPGVTTRLADYRVEMQKLLNGVAGTTYLAGSNYFGTGPVICWLGQSLAVQQRTNNSHSITGTLASDARFQSSGYDATMRGNYPPGCSLLQAPGYGEGFLSQIIGNALGYNTMPINSALSGSSIAQWVANVSGFNSSSPLGVLSNAIADIQRFRPKYIIWHQGQNSTGVSYSSYFNDLAALYAALSSAISWPWFFLVLPMNNTYTANQPIPSEWAVIRQAQVDWTNAQIAAGDTKVVLAGSVVDVASTAMNADGIHCVAVAGGYGFYAERMAQTLLFLEGNVANSGLGPVITGMSRISSTVSRFIVTPNGGTGLQKPNAGAITGFEISVNNFASDLAISDAEISAATTIDVTHADDGGIFPMGRYQYGLPGPATGGSNGTTASQGLSNPVYDNRSPAINTTLGFPVLFTPEAIQSV